MPRDMTPPPKRTAEEITRDAEITEADLIHAEETATRLATPDLQRMLNATEQQPSE